MDWLASMDGDWLSHLGSGKSSFRSRSQATKSPTSVFKASGSETKAGGSILFKSDMRDASQHCSPVTA